jgi:hypothetical protein
MYKLVQTSAMLVNRYIGRATSRLLPIIYSILFGILCSTPASAGTIYGVYDDTFIGYPTVLAGIDSHTGNVSSTQIVGQYFGGGAVAPLQYSTLGLAYGNGQLYGAYTDTFIG